MERADKEKQFWTLSNHYQTSFRRLRALRQEVLLETEITRSSAPNKVSKGGVNLLHWIVFLFVAASVAGGGYFAYYNFMGEGAVSRKSATLPTLPQFQGNRIDGDTGLETPFYSSTLTGRTVALLFWGSDSKSIDWLKAMRNHSDSGVLSGSNAVIVCVFVGQDRDQAMKLVRRYGSDKLIVLDDSDAENVSRAFGEPSIPALFAYDAFGRQVGDELFPEQVEMAFSLSQ
ncbi:hypothetical protein MLD52_15580 [Puniceicoccaceae bacterium K14]|nr:hypothetical protein [Puniceicoccaceae bacterium K14]